MAITYTPTTNFGAKDSLPSNDPDKVIKGSEFSVEFTAIQTAFGLAASAASPTFTGTVTIPTADINGGAIDGTTIGGTTPAAASFTTVSATGNITVGGTVDGRDVAADGTKLDGVEAGADVTDTANVTAAGALMDSELADIAAVKALNQGVATTDSPSFAGLTATGSVSLAGASTSADITFGDNDKAIFGAGSDLQIYHDGSNSIITDSGAGSLLLRGSNVWIQNADGTETGARFITDGAIDLRYDNAVKLATTATGIDVTGTVTADGLTVGSSGSVLINATSRSLPSVGAPQVQLEGSGTGASTFLTTNTASDATPSAFALLKARGTSVVQINDELGRISFNGWDGSQEQEAASISTFVDTFPGTADMPGRLVFKTTPNASATPLERMRIDNGGDISFYEDTGTTAKFFWDASAESLGIGTSSPSGNLEIATSASDTGVDLVLDGNRTTNGGIGSIIFNNNGDSVGMIRSNRASADDAADMLFYTQATGGANTERMRITSAGNVGIGVSSPSDALVVEGNVASPHRIKVSNANASGSETLSFTQGSTVKSWVEFNNSTSNFDVWQYTNNALRFGTNNIERMRINSSGNVGIGTTSPDTQLHVYASSGDAEHRIEAVGSGNDTILSLKNLNTGAGAEGHIRFMDGSVTSGLISYLHNAGGVSDAMTFSTAGSERMRIDSSGNLLVGKATSSIATAGTAIRGDNPGLINSVRNGVILELNRLSTDGAIVDFFKDGTTVGSIGTVGGRLTTGSGDTGLAFEDTNNRIIPHNISTNAFRDAAIDLGYSSGRFKDLYLSGGVYLGGTGAANKLDDYETGTFTATLKVGADTKGTTTAASYVKVGDMVYISLDFAATTISAVGASTGVVSIAGLPFTSGGQGRQSLPAPFSLGAVFTVNLNQVLPNINLSTTSISFHNISGATSSGMEEGSFTTSDVVASYLRISGVYAAA